jgi:hypothetical protein
MRVIVSSFFMAIFVVLAAIGWAPGTLAAVLADIHDVGTIPAFEGLSKTFCQIWMMMGLLYVGLSLVLGGGGRSVYVANLAEYFERKQSARPFKWAGLAFWRR